MEFTSDEYSRFGLVRDMAAVPEIIARFDPNQATEIAAGIASLGLLMTGEGSSRIFPAKSAIVHARRCGWPITLHTEAGRQAQEYDLSDWAVFALSNSGRTAEVIGLFSRLKEAGHNRLYSLTAFPDTRLQSLASRGWVLSCGEEAAVAATKSVIEQALFYRALLEHAAGSEAPEEGGRGKAERAPAPRTPRLPDHASHGARPAPVAPPLKDRLASLAEDFRTALTASIPKELIEKIAAAGTIYWAGRNDGVAEELTLKTNEITRKRSDFLEGTYAVHGVEEVMDADDVVLWIDPWADSEEKFEQVLVNGVGLTVIAVASRQTRFPTIRIPDAGDLAPFIQMAAGWNILVETGLALDINIDKPQRARKVGYEFSG